MKKTILAVVTSTLLAASAQAATVYDKDGQTVDVYGRVQYEAGKQVDQNFGGDSLARFGFNGKWATGSDVSLIGKLEWQATSENDQASDKSAQTLESRYAFAGADFGNGVQATVGTQDSAFVELSDVTDVYNTYSGIVENAGDSRWDDSAKVTYTADGWDLRSSVSFTDAEKASSATPDAKRKYSAAAGYTFAIDSLSSIKPVVAYQASEANDYTDEQYAAGVGYTYDALYLATTYGQAKYESDADHKDTIWAVTATYKFLPELTGVVGYGLVDGHNYTSTNAKEYYVFGAQYDITPKAKAYAEFQQFVDTAHQDDQAYTVGLQYNF